MEEINENPTPEEQVNPAPVVDAAETPEPQKKRGRGRPPKAPDATVIPRKPKNGDPQTTKGEKPNDTITNTAEFYARQVEGMHMMASMLTGLDLTIKTEEAKTLGEAIYLVVKEYDLAFISKYAPILNLAATTIMVEVPVVMRATAAVKTKKEVKGEIKAKAKPGGPGVEVGTPLQIVPNPMGGIELGQAYRS